MKKLLNMMGLCAVIALIASSTSMAAFWNTKTLEGTVAHIEKNILTVMQQSSDQLKVAVQVQTNEKTEYTKISSIEQLKKGDQVEISYQEENGQNIATSIVKVEPYDKNT